MYSPAPTPVKHGREVEPPRPPGAPGWTAAPPRP